MLEGQIGNNWFVYDKDSNKNTVFQKGDVDPVAYISVNEDLSEKNFHYEIMDWSLQNS